jgi:hypothetical protein
MATPHKRITTNESQPKEKGTYLTKENWEVMKPFVHFAFKAMALMSSAIFAVVKLVPKALEHKDEDRKDKRIIKI